MSTLITLGAIALALVLLGLVPLGVDAAYAGGGFSLAVRAGFVSIRLGQKGTAATKKAEKPKKSKETEKPADEKKPRPSWPVLKILVKNGYTMLCRLVSRLRVGYLRAHFTAAGGPDPAAAAMEYGAAALAMDALSRLGGKRIGRSDLRADVDFEAASPVVDARLVLTLRLGQLLGASARFGAGFLIDYGKYRRELRRKGA